MIFEIPIMSGQSLSVPMSEGETLFFLGANGSGKSALIQHLVSSHRKDKVRRIPAHRHLTFESELPNFSYPDRSQFDNEIRNLDVQTAARWRENSHLSQQKHLAVLSDFLANENSYARSILDLVRSGQLDEAQKQTTDTFSPLEKLNQLFGAANLTASLMISNGREILATHGDFESSLSIAQLSDGERSAVIMAINVLTVEPGTVLLIDEPERHLHRSIIEPFLSALFEQRKDCFFVISTHEVALPIANPNARVLVIYGCDWRGTDAQAWDVHLLSENTDLPEDLKMAILGARRRILFVEGEDQSLDRAFYGSLFPGILIVSKGNCGEVQRAVKGLRDAENLHHTQAFGLIDEDGRATEEVIALASRGVFSLNLYSVESLYYCADSIETIARRQAASFGEDAETLIEEAIDAALTKLDDELARQMVARRSERAVRRLLFAQMPSWKNLINESASNVISLSVGSPYDEELKHFTDLVSARDLDGLIARYPLRHSNLFAAIAKTLKCRERDDYEKMVVAQIRSDKELAHKLRGRISEVSSAIAASEGCGPCLNPPVPPLTSASAPASPARPPPQPSGP